MSDAEPTEIEAAPAPYDDGMCRNCGAELGLAFCELCGQRRIRNRLRTSQLFRDAWTTLSDLDRGFLCTIRDLTLRPGKTIRAYIDGRRARFTSPVRYYLTTLAVVLLIPAVLEIDVGVPGLLRAVSQGAYADWDELQIATHLRYYKVGLVPVYALILTGLFRRRQQTFAENVVCALYVTAQTYLLTIVAYLLQGVGVGDPFGVFEWIEYVYVFWAVSQYTGDPWWRVMFKAIIVFTVLVKVLIAPLLGSLRFSAIFQAITA